MPRLPITHCNTRGTEVSSGSTPACPPSVHPTDLSDYNAIHARVGADATGSLTASAWIVISLSPFILIFYHPSLAPGLVVHNLFIVMFPFAPVLFVSYVLFPMTLHLGLLCMCIDFTRIHDASCRPLPSSCERQPLHSEFPLTYLILILER